MDKEIDIIELFSGIGGFTKGFEDAGYVIKNHYFSEIDKHAVANYKYNYPHAKALGSVINVSGSGLRADVITFGSPCQDFSLAGKRAGMAGQRSSLISQAIRLISEIRPAVFIWENVKGTFFSNHGADFWAIIAAFAHLGGYRLEWQLLNTSWFLPQNRERIYLVGYLADRSRPGVFPISENGELANQTFREKADRTKTANTLSSAEYKLNCETNYVKVNSGTKQGYEVANDGDSINFSNLNSKTRRGRVGKEKAQTIDTQANKGVLVQDKIRRLTEIECERLQGFPDDWTKYGNYDGVVKQIPKTQRYKMCGNAVTVAVVRAIAERLKINK